MYYIYKYLSLDFTININWISYLAEILVHHYLYQYNQGYEGTIHVFMD